MDFINQVEPYITNDEKEAIAEYLNSGGWLTEFRKTREFESMLAEFTGARHAVVVTSGTVALYLALRAAGIGPGDKVIVPNYTMIATPNVVLWAGAEPVLVDVEPDTLCLDLESVRVEKSTKAIMYVSIGGRSGDMNKVVAFCRDHGLLLIEDSCQSLGSRWNGKSLGTFGKLGAYSFTPHKIITTGQGGAVVSDDDKLIGRVKKLKDFHRTAPAIDRHDGLGFNFKFTDLQAVIGIAQMKHIDLHIVRRKKVFRRYSEMLEDIDDVKFLPTNLDVTTPWFVEAILPSEEIRDLLASYLKEKGIGSRPFYPPINHQDMFVSRYPRGTFTVSESMAIRGLWLPSSIGLTQEQVAYVCETIKTFFKKERP